jgi:hypothetical protein
MDMTLILPAFSFVLLTITSMLSVPFLMLYLSGALSVKSYICERECHRCEEMKPLESTHMLCDDCVNELVTTRNNG